MKVSFGWKSLVLSLCSTAAFGESQGDVSEFIRPAPTCMIPSPGSSVLPLPMYNYCDEETGFPADDIIPRFVQGAVELSHSDPKLFASSMMQISGALEVDLNYPLDPSLEKEALNEIWHFKHPKLSKFIRAAKVVCKVGLAATPAFDLYNQYECTQRAQTYFDQCVEKCEDRFPPSAAFNGCVDDCHDVAASDVKTCAIKAGLDLLDPGLLALIDSVRAFLGKRGLESYIFPHWYPEELDPVYLPYCEGSKIPFNQEY